MTEFAGKYETDNLRSINCLMNNVKNPGVVAQRRREFRPLALPAPLGAAEELQYSTDSRRIPIVLLGKVDKRDARRQLLRCNVALLVVAHQFS